MAIPPGMLVEEGSPRHAEVTRLQGAHGRAQHTRAQDRANQEQRALSPGRGADGRVWARLTSLSAWLGGGLASAGTRCNKPGANPHSYVHGRYTGVARCRLLPRLGSAHRKQVWGLPDVLQGSHTKAL